MFGKIFKEVTGKSASDFPSITEIEDAVEKINRSALHVCHFESRVVPPRGNIFNFTNVRRNLDSEIEELLKISRPKLHAR